MDTLLPASGQRGAIANKRVEVMMTEVEWIINFDSGISVEVTFPESVDERFYILNFIDNYPGGIMQLFNPYEKEFRACLGKVPLSLLYKALGLKPFGNDEPECKCNLFVGHTADCEWKAWKEGR